MKRWNGWGDDTRSMHLPPSAQTYLTARVGVTDPAPDATWPAVLATVPASRVPTPHSLITTEAEERLRHARGQSLPDWIALRSGQIGAFPDGVAYPTSDEDVRELLAYARATGVRLIPYGGGSSVVGHINPRVTDGPTVTVDMTRLSHLLAFDETSRLATFGAGVYGPDLEAQLNKRGYMLGHFPQSFEFSTLGGWIAARSSGQQSYHYGRIEDLFAGGHLETPQGALDLPSHPASAAGPDVRQMVLGSEGRLGFITRATVRVRPMPEAESFRGAFFRDWETGVQAVRAIAQDYRGVSMLRLSNALETQTTLELVGHENLLKWADRGLRLAGYGPERCLLIFGITGDRMVRALNGPLHQTLDVIRAHGGLAVGQAVGKRWQKSRFTNPYLRNNLWEAGYALDTLETVFPWVSVIEGAQAMITTLQNGLRASDERVLAFAHLSHVYPTGASVYVTYLYRRAADPGETLRRWQVLKTAASQAIVAQGGTISHQHGVGLDHVPYLAAEKGALGVQMLQSVIHTLDPQGLMNPGKLLES